MDNKRSYVKKHTNYINTVGQVIDKFVIIEELGHFLLKPNSKQKKKVVKIECLLCGSQFDTQYINLKVRPKVCCQPKKKRDNDQKRIYKIYFGMKQRCYNKKNPRYDLYGERGLGVCKEWLEDKESFYTWSINNGYQKSLTIDRIDNNQGYSPKNCRWTSEATQSRNRRHVLDEATVKEIKKCLVDGLTHQNIADRLLVTKSKVSNISAGKCWTDIQWGQNNGINEGC